MQILIKQKNGINNFLIKIDDEYILFNDQRIIKSHCYQEGFNEITLNDKEIISEMLDTLLKNIKKLHISYLEIADKEFKDLYETKINFYESKTKQLIKEFHIKESKKYSNVFKYILKS